VCTIFGAKHRPHHSRSGPAAIEAVIETPRYDLTWFKVTFGRLAVKAYTKCEHVLRFEAITHNTRDPQGRPGAGPVPRHRHRAGGHRQTA
jgi:hypothetical protein